MKLMNDSGIDLCHMVLSLCYPNKNTTTMAWPTFPTFYLFTAELKQLLLVKPNCLEKYFPNILSLHWASQRVKIGEVPISFPTESSLTSFSPTRVNVKFLFVEQYTNNPSFIYYEKKTFVSQQKEKSLREQTFLRYEISFHEKSNWNAWGRFWSPQQPGCGKVDLLMDGWQTERWVNGGIIFFL